MGANPCNTLPPTVHVSAHTQPPCNQRLRAEGSFRVAFPTFQFLLVFSLLYLYPSPPIKVQNSKLPETVPGELEDRLYLKMPELVRRPTWRFAVHSQHLKHQYTAEDHPHHHHQEAPETTTVPIDVPCGPHRNHVS